MYTRYANQVSQKASLSFQFFLALFIALLLPLKLRWHVALAVLSRRVNLYLVVIYDTRNKAIVTSKRAPSEIVGWARVLLS